MPARNRPALTLTPDELAFVGEAPAEPGTAAAEVEAPKPAKPKGRAPKVEPLPPTRHEAPPARHRVLQSGELKRTLTGFVPPELGDRLDAYCTAEERTVSWVLTRALDAWLAKQ